MKIKQEVNNRLFNRKEIVFEINSEKNPSFDEMRKVISDKFSKPEENINVFGIKGSFGKDSFVVKAFVYDSKKDLEKAVHKSRKQRREEKNAAEEAKKAEAEAKKNAENAKSSEV